MHVICNIILYFSLLSAVEKRWEPHIYYCNPQTFLGHVSQGGVFSVEVIYMEVIEAEALTHMQFQNEHCRWRQMRKDGGQAAIWRLLTRCRLKNLATGRNLPG